MGKQRGLLALIIALVAGALWLVFEPQNPIPLGLDLQGGAQLTIQVKPTKEIPEISVRDLQAVTRVIENRVNALGVSEALVQTSGQSQIIVQLPGVNDPQQAERVLGGTAQLEFRAQKANTDNELRGQAQILMGIKLQEAELRQAGAAKAKELKELQGIIKKGNEAIVNLFEPPKLTGTNLKDAYAIPAAQNTSNWEVSLKFDGPGGDLFAALSKEIAGTGRTLGIFLDNALISSPVVGAEFAQTGITGGGAVITGRFGDKEAADLAIQLKGGALPLPVEIVENRTIGATLGRDSIQSSIYAGVGGLSLVLIFMAVYYRLPGIIADISLVVYSLLTLAAFDLLRVTLTLPGIAGFILSIGMAVDANVLIFERTREELQSGKSLYRSVESGFYRAFSSILDSNVTTLIACAALFYLGSGFVRGFALTLAVGVFVSMFTALTCSRTLLMTALNFPSLKKPEFFAPNVPKPAK
jgi:preprotein translocase subunit SecD